MNEKLHSVSELKDKIIDGINTPLSECISESEVECMNEKLYSVSEFAKKVGLSRQAVYKRLSTDLSIYVVNVDNKQMLSAKAFEQFKVSTDKEKSSTLSTVDTLNRMVKHLEKEVEQLRAEKEALKQELAEEREQNKQNAAELRSLSATVGDSLRHLTIGQAAAETKLLADTMQQQVPIEQKHKRHWWQRKE